MDTPKETRIKRLRQAASLYRGLFWLNLACAIATATTGGVLCFFHFGLSAFSMVLRTEILEKIQRLEEDLENEAADNSKDNE